MQTNLTVTPIAYEVTVPTEEQVEAGAPEQAVVTVVSGSALPIANPQTQEPLIMPLMNIQFGLDKEHMTQLGNLLLEKAEELPDPKPQSDILIAGNMSDAEKAAQAFKGFAPNNGQ